MTLESLSYDVAVLLFLAILLCLEVGYRVGRRRHARTRLDLLQPEDQPALRALFPKYVDARLRFGLIRLDWTDQLLPQLKAMMR